MTRPVVHVVLRSAGERTLEAAQSILSVQCPQSALSVLSVRPFAKALELGIEAVLESKARWAIFADADVLLRRGAIDLILTELENVSEDFYMVNFRVLDRGFGGPAYAGVHGYDAHRFEGAQNFIALAYKDQRPETRLCKEMARRGFNTINSSAVVGLHDYEQYYADLYRKMFVRAVKYRSQLQYMYNSFTQDFAENVESRAMLMGLYEGAIFAQSGGAIVPLDTAFFAERALPALRLIGLAERQPLESNWVPDVDAVINRFQPSPSYRANQHWIAPETRVAPFPGPPSVSARIKSTARRILGPLKRGFEAGGRKKGTDA